MRSAQRLHNKAMKPTHSGLHGFIATLQLGRGSYNLGAGDPVSLINKQRCTVSKRLSLLLRDECSQRSAISELFEKWPSLCGVIKGVGGPPRYSYTGLARQLDAHSLPICPLPSFLPFLRRSVAPLPPQSSPDSPSNEALEVCPNRTCGSAPRTVDL
jgi:hypothetical protein